MKSIEIAFNKELVSKTVMEGYALANMAMEQLDFIDNYKKNLRGHLRNAAINYAFHKNGFNCIDSLNSVKNYIYTKVLIQKNIVMTMSHVNESASHSRPSQYREALSRLYNYDLFTTDLENVVDINKESIYAELLHSGEDTPSKIIIDFPLIDIMPLDIPIIHGFNAEAEIQPVEIDKMKNIFKLKSNDR